MQRPNCTRLHTLPLTQSCNRQKGCKLGIAPPKPWLDKHLGSIGKAAGSTSRFDLFTEDRIRTYRYRQQLLFGGLMLNNEAVELYYQRFVGNSGQFYEQKPDGSYRPSNRPLTFPAVWSHLSGSITIGFPAVDSEGFCRWICFDDDHFLPADATGLLDRIECPFSLCELSLPT